MKAIARSLFRFSRNVIDRPAVILLYHRVTDLSLDPQQLSVSPENFDAQISHLRKYYSLIGVEEFASAFINKKKLPKRSVVITFDDGYADNFHAAIPILERHRAQGLFYIATANLDIGRELWWDDLERIFLLDNVLPTQLNFECKEVPYTFSTSTKLEKEKTYNALHPILKDCDAGLRDQLMLDITRWAQLPTDGRSSHRMMTADELIKMSQSAAAVIGAHTHNHPKLSVCTVQQQEREILQSKEILSKLLNRQIDHFSYPFGSRIDYTRDTVEICQRAGFKMVCSNFHEQVHSWHSPFELPRILVRNWTPHDFKKKMETFFTF
jgi:peptidoglycan/xylan/chitin deacetylase (PgdA/CDA1 family)